MSTYGRARSRVSPANIIGITVFTISALIVLTVLRGLVLQALWSWFVVETFTVESLTLVQAIGLSLVVGFLTYQYDARQDSDDKGALEQIIAGFIAGLIFNGFIFLAGAIVHSLA